jgi:hypothetical protein
MSKIHEKCKKNCICCEIELGKDFVFLHKTRRQTHLLCNDCAKGYLNPKIQIITKNLKKNIRYTNYVIKCPGTYCGSLRNQCNFHINIKNIKFSDEKSDLYTDFFRVLYTIENENIILCPSNCCGEILELNLNIIDTYVKCPSCKINFCKNCLCLPYHKNMTCFEYELENMSCEGSKCMTELKAKGYLKYCPQCKSPTIKSKDKYGVDTGCNKMICTVCSVKWCWLCEKFPIDYDHYNKNSNLKCSNKLWEGTVIGENII